MGGASPVFSPPKANLEDNLPKCGTAPFNKDPKADDLDEGAADWLWCQELAASENVNAEFR